MANVSYHQIYLGLVQCKCESCKRLKCACKPEGRPQGKWKQLTAAASCRMKVPFGSWISTRPGVCTNRAEGPGR